MNSKNMSILEIIVILLFSTYYILPSVEGDISLIPMVIFSLAYILYCVMSDKRIFRFICVYVGGSFLLGLIFTLLTDSQTISTELSYGKLRQFLSIFSQYLFMYLPVLFAYRVINNATKKRQKVVFLVISIMFLFVTITTLQELAINPGIIRHWEEFSEMEKENIGNYYFVYSVPIIITTLVISSMNKPIQQKVVFIVFIVLLFYFILKAEYTLALIVTLVGVIIAIYRSMNNGISKTIFLFISFACILFLPDILLFIANNIGSASMSLRIMEIYDFFSSGSTEGYNLNGRLNLYKKAILAFLHSPLYGNRVLDFNGHALFLTVLADTGIIGGIPFYYLLITAKKQINIILNDKYKKFIPILLCFIFIGLVNPIQKSYPVSFSAWFFAPLAINLFYEEEYSL